MNSLKPKLNKQDIENNILNLKIISKITEGDKLSTSENIIKIDPPSITRCK